MWWVLVGLFAFHSFVQLLVIIGFRPLIALLVAVLCIVAFGLFSWYAPSPPKISFAELEEQGLLMHTDFRAIRAFRIEADDDEGPHYFVELENKSILYLNGPFLDGTEPNDYEPGVNLPRRFPCTEFTVRRHRNEGWTIDIICRGEVLEPEIYGVGFSDGFDQEVHIPQDGDIITNRTYDKLKSLVIIEEYD